jgi:hypothetical protein
VSALFLLTHASSVGGFARMVSAGGSGAVVDKGAVERKLAERVGEGVVVVNQRVTAVTTAEDDTVVVSTATDRSFTCRRVICAVPAASANRIDFHPPLGDALAFTLANMAPGLISTFEFRTKKSPAAGDGWTAESPYTVLYEVASRDRTVGILGGKQCLRWSTDPSSFVHRVQDYFNVGEVSARHGVTSVCTPRPGAMAHYHTLRQPDGKVHFAGPDTATR